MATPTGLKSWTDLAQNASEATMHLGVKGEDLNSFLQATIINVDSSDGLGRDFLVLSSLNLSIQVSCVYVYSGLIDR